MSRELPGRIRSVLDAWNEKYINISRQPGAFVGTIALHGEGICLDALAEIGQLVGWESEND